METNKTFTAFAGFKQIASGDLKTLLPATLTYISRDKHAQILIFDDATGQQVDFDLQHTPDEALSTAQQEPVRKPGRPKLGVVSREISLLPRHWEWLDNQPRSASGTIRRLVEEARKKEAGPETARRRREAAGKFMWALAGNLENFEEASRALYAGDQQLLKELISDWPEDVCRYLLKLWETEQRETMKLEQE